MGVGSCGWMSYANVSLMVRTSLKFTKAILSVLKCVWPLGPDMVVWTYLHILILFLQLETRDNEWCSGHGWSDR